MNQDRPDSVVASGDGVNRGGIARRDDSGNVCGPSESCGSGMVDVGKGSLGEVSRRHPPSNYPRLGKIRQ